jgi:hypothetical protein
MNNLTSLNLGGKPPNESPQWVTLQAEAKRRGTTTRALKALCQRLGIWVRKEGKFNWVRPNDIDEALNHQVTPPPPSPNSHPEALAALLLEMKGGR